MIKASRRPSQEVYKFETRRGRLWYEVSDDDTVKNVKIHSVGITAVFAGGQND